ncbi:MAG: hypothetical protein PHO66_04075 [Eubacteriales bacterium]|nr:hypothetical protein [Eubacteriales bacterium]
MPKAQEKAPETQGKSAAPPPRANAALQAALMQHEYMAQRARERARLEASPPAYEAPPADCDAQSACDAGDYPGDSYDDYDDEEDDTL